MPRPARRLAVECLEDRAVLNSRFVVPVEVPADGFNNFYTLREALTTPGLVPGDVVQIEPLSNPGELRDGDLPFVRNLTIRGNPAVGSVETPAFVVPEPVSIFSSRAGFTLRDVRVVLPGGTFYLYAAATISNSHMTTYAAPVAQLNDTTGVRLDTNTFVGSGTNATLLTVDTIADSANTVIGNRFLPNSHNRSPQNAVVRYSELDSGTSSQPTQDQFVGNTLVSAPGYSGFPMLAVGYGVSGLTVSGNTFIDPTRSYFSGVRVDFSGVENLTVQRLTVAGNTFRGLFSAVHLETHTGARLDAVVERNVFDSRPGGDPADRTTWQTGLNLFLTSGTSPRLTVQGNDFQYTRLGVYIAGTGSAQDVDLGGGTLASRGGNSFRGFTTATAASQTPVAAIFAPFSTSTDPLYARFNAFSVSDPEAVIYDKNDASTYVNVVATNPLTANQAFVQALYIRLLSRMGDVFNTADAGGWVAALEGGGQTVASVARGVGRSPEGIGSVVRLQYQQYLSREPDAGGLNGFVAAVQNGATLEAVAAGLINSPEYRNGVGGTDAAFVQSLYARLLGRRGSSADVDGWLPRLQQVGRSAAVLQFLGGAEYRGNAVRAYYANLLKRTTPPSDGEVANWVSSPLSAFDMQLVFMGTDEFRLNG